MKHQAFRPVAVMLSVILITSVTARAGTIEFADVAPATAVSNGLRPAAELRLRVTSQSGQVADGTQSPQNSGASSPDQTNGTNTATPQAGSVTPSTDATLTQGSGQVETVDLGDVTGTVCDCGEIPIERVPGKGFPKWPFLLLTPLVCVTGICTGDDTPPNTPLPPSTPTPTPPQTPVPEPATLLLFGSGLLALGAGARRRHADRLANAESIAATEEV